MSKFGDYLLLKVPPPVEYPTRSAKNPSKQASAVPERIPDAPSSIYSDENLPTPPSKISGARIAFSLIGLLLGIFLSFVIVGINSSTGTTVAPGFKTVHWEDLWKFGLITLVICGLTYQGLYLSLKLYVNEPAFLTIFIAFQYGFFWQAVIHGSASLIHA